MILPLLTLAFLAILLYVTYYDWVDGKVYIMPLIPLFIVAYIYRFVAGGMLEAIMCAIMLGSIFVMIYLVGQIGAGDVFLSPIIGLFIGNLFHLQTFLLLVLAISIPYTVAWYIYYYYFTEYDLDGWGFRGFSKQIPTSELKVDMIVDDGHFIRFTTEDDIKRLQKEREYVKVRKFMPAVPLMFASLIIILLWFGMP